MINITNIIKFSPEAIKPPLFSENYCKVNKVQQFELCPISNYEFIRPSVVNM